MSNKEKYGKVAVLMGGLSAEREISLQSGEAVLNALKANDVDAHALDVGKDVLEQLPFDDEIKKALLGENSRFRPVYDIIVAYECGDWEAFSQHAKALDIQESQIPDIYTGALKWAGNAFTNDSITPAHDQSAELSTLSVN